MRGEVYMFSDETYDQIQIILLMVVVGLLVYIILHNIIQM